MANRNSFKQSRPHIPGRPFDFQVGSGEDPDQRRLFAIVRTLANQVDTLTTVVNNLGGGSLTATEALRPAANSDGTLFFPSDGYEVERDNGTAYAPWGPLFPFTAPDDSIYSWVNQGSATVTTTKGGIYLLSPAAGTGTSGNFRTATAPATGTPTTAFFLTSCVTDKQYPKAGMFFRDSVGGRMVTFHVAAGFLWLTKWSSATAISADYSSRGLTQWPGWMQILDDNTNLIFRISSDGQNFIQVESRARHDWLAAGPDQVGFFTEAQNSGTPNYDASMLLLSWS